MSIFSGQWLSTVCEESNPPNPPYQGGMRASGIGNRQ